MFTTTLSSTTAQAADTITATEGSVHETTSVTFSSKVIEAFGSTSLVQVGNNFFLENISSGNWSRAEIWRRHVVAGQFGSGWTPIGAEQTAVRLRGGLEDRRHRQYTVWSTDSNGNYISNAIGECRRTSDDAGID